MLIKLLLSTTTRYVLESVAAPRSCTDELLKGQLREERAGQNAFNTMPLSGSVPVGWQRLRLDMIKVCSDVCECGASGAHR